MAAEYLVAKGHGRIAMLNLSSDHMGYEARTRAFVDTAKLLEAESHTIVDDRFEQGTSFMAEFDEQSVKELVASYLAIEPRPTGLFVPRDSLTVMVYHELRAQGVEPGRDVEVISCNNESVIGGLDPRPATLDLRAEVIGRQAVEQLILRIQKPHDPVSVVSAVEPRLVEGSRPEHFGEN